MSIDRSKVRGLVRAIAYDLKGARLGRVAQVFLDDRTDEPAWVAVDVTRVRGMRLLPLADAGLHGKHLVIRAERATVRSAPRIDLGDGQLSSQDESRLLEHYGLTPSGRPEAAPDTDQRPVSPWPDDTERETAWERPAEASGHAQDTQAFPPPTAQGWEQPSASSGTGDSEAIGEDAREGDDPRAIPSGRSDTEPATMTPTATAVPPVGSDEDATSDQQPEPAAAPPPPRSQSSPATAPQAQPATAPQAAQPAPAQSDAAETPAAPPDAAETPAAPPDAAETPAAPPPPAAAQPADPPTAPTPATAPQQSAPPPAAPPPSPDPAPVSPARPPAVPTGGAREPEPDAAVEPSPGEDRDPR